MKKITFSFLFILTAICSSISFGQTTRYLDPVFDVTEIKETKKIVYATNFSVALGANMPVPTGTNNIPIGADTTIVGTDTTITPILFNMPALEMDVFEPTADSVTERPLIIYLHTGTFAPIFRNGNATGSRTFDWATQKFCMEYAKRGYVVANTDYRYGWNPLLPTEPERATSLIKAAFRGIQDVKSAIRFLRMDYENGNTYGIDTSRIIICGQGTGGWIATCLNSVDKLAELQIPKFLDAVTAQPLLDTAIEGDWFGYGGSPTNNMENHKGYSSAHDMILNMGGAIGDLSWLEAGDKPIVAVHGNLDAVARFTTGNLTTTGVNVVSDISGSHDVIAKANMLGNNNSVPDLYDPYTIAAKKASNNLIGTTDFSGDTITASVNNLFPFNTGNPGEGAPWDFWDSATILQLAVGAFGPTVGPVQANAAIASSLQTNPTMSMNKAMAYVDSTLGFFCPRIINTLMLPGNSVGITDFKMDVNIYPNPSSDFITINSSTNINLISIFNNNGILMGQFKPNRFTYSLDLRSYAKGFYFAEISNASTTKTEKFVLK